MSKNTKTLTISNDGELELNAIALMGASTKRGDDTKIGMFGTGFKYAISVLMRTDYTLSIASGKQLIKFSTTAAKLGGKDFSQIVMSVKSPLGRTQKIPLSFTTEMGLQWTIDNAMREIICNAKDAGGLKISTDTPPAKADGITHVYLTREAEGRDRAREHVADFDKYYLFNRTPIYKDAKLSIYEKTDDCINVFRNGVRVFRNEKYRSVFDYEADVEIDERRQAGTWAVQYTVASNLGRLNREQLLKILAASGDTEYFESTFSSFHGGLSLVAVPPDNSVYCTAEQANFWAAGKYGRILEAFRPFIVSDAAYLCFKDMSNSRTIHHVLGARAEGLEEIEFSALSDLEKLTFNTAHDFCAAAGYSIPRETFKFYDDNDDTIYGQYTHGAIWIKRKGLTRGAFETVHTIMHELAHMKSGQGDETRAFEDYILRELVSLMQHKAGRAL